MKSYYRLPLKEKGSFLIETLVAVAILTGSVLGVFKVISINDYAEYDYIQRVVISTEIYNYYSICSVLLSRKFSQNFNQIKIHFPDLSTTASVASNCNTGASEADFVPTLAGNGYKDQRDLWLSNVLRNHSLPLINSKVAIGIVAINRLGSQRAVFTAYACFKSLNMKENHYSFSGALPLTDIHSVNIDGQPIEDIVWCQLDSIPDAACRFFYENGRPRPYVVNYKLPYTVDRKE
ncbi:MULTISPECIES: hypothetical protein [Candidatus Ichthyocystis]|uniref:Putative membrane protein n=1 Tax=Candidatus Ichthyocystis hellenicum TaxID=1561003 RepID=A0A0S4M5I1_9BURK|nr:MULTISPECIES: hypothetical protein [Ichthyocystis]CUT17501.1 putative membrane protein [Candidatus Ichthyocystis hellenicum]